jgi:hypothetical protein
MASLREDVGGVHARLAAERRELLALRAELSARDARASEDRAEVSFLPHTHTLSLAHTCIFSRGVKGVGEDVGGVHARLAAERRELPG